MRYLGEEVCREYDKTPEIDITAIPDGTYSAKWGKVIMVTTAKALQNK